MFNPLRLLKKERTTEIQQNRALDGFNNSPLSFPFGGVSYQYSNSNHNFYENVSTVYACDRVISNHLAINRLQIVKPSGSGREAIADHPLNRLISLQPNERDTGFEFHYRKVSHLNRFGNGVSFIDRDENFTPIGLYPLNPQTTRAVNEPLNGQPESPSNPNVFHYITVINKQVVRLSPYSVLHIKAADIDGFNGVSVIEKYRRLFSVADAQETFSDKFYKNGLSAGKVVSYPAEFEAADLEALRKDVDRFSGSSGAHKAMILQDSIKVENIGMSLDDAQFIESKKFTREEISGLFGVPISLIDGSYSKYDKVGFVTGVLGSIGSLIEQEYTLKLLSEDEIDSGVRFRFDWSESLRLDPERQSKVHDTRLKNGSAMINEVRAELGLMPVPGGDITLIEGEKIRLVDAGAKYASGIQQTSETPAETEQTPDAEESTESLSERLKPLVDDWLSRSNTKALNAFKRLEKKHEGVDLRAAVADLEREHRDFLSESGEPIARALGMDAERFDGVICRYAYELVEGFRTADSKDIEQQRAYADQTREALVRKLTQ